MQAKECERVKERYLQSAGTPAKMLRSGESHRRPRMPSTLPPPPPPSPLDFSSNRMNCAVGWVSNEVERVNGTVRGGGAKCETWLTATAVGRVMRAVSSSTTRPRVVTVDRGEETGVWANSLTHHTRELSYVAHKISQNVPRFVQKLLNGDGGVWVSWLTPTRVGVSVFVLKIPPADA